MEHIQHQKDRRRFKQNFQLASQAERDMEAQREKLGLPTYFKGSQKFKILPFRPNQSN